MLSHERFTSLGSRWCDGTLIDLAGLRNCLEEMLMRRLRRLLAMLLVTPGLACSTTTAPTPAPTASDAAVAAPSPGPPAPVVPRAFLWGMVITQTGSCVAEATVEVVRGQRAGEKLLQSTPCGAWDYGGGFTFTDLTAGSEMTLRATASGWSTAEKTFIPQSGPQSAVFLVLSPS